MGPVNNDMFYNRGKLIFRFRNNFETIITRLIKIFCSCLYSHIQFLQPCLFIKVSSNSSTKMQFDIREFIICTWFIWRYYLQKVTQKALYTNFTLIFITTISLIWRQHNLIDANIFVRLKICPTFYNNHFAAIIYCEGTPPSCVNLSNKINILTNNVTNHIIISLQGKYSRYFKIIRLKYCRDEHFKINI